MQPRYIPYYGDTGELLTTKEHLNWRWLYSECKILFSVTQQGKAAVCHFTSDKAGLRHLEEAINDWTDFCFWLFDWCEAVIGVIEKRSVARVAERCGYTLDTVIDDKQHVYIRRP